MRPGRVAFGPLAVLAAGIAFLGAAGHAWKQTDGLLDVAVPAVGEVISMRGEDRHVRPENRGEAEETFRPVVRFTTREGRQVGYESITSSYPPRYSERDVVRILYDPTKPERARIDDFADLWLRAVFLAVVGSILSLLGADSLRAHAKLG